MPPAVAAVVEAAYAAEAEGAPSACLEEGVLTRFEILWNMGWTVVPRRGLLAHRIAIIAIIIASGAILLHFVNDGVEHTSLLGAATYGLGVASGALLLAWIHPDARAATWRAVMRKWRAEGGSDTHLGTTEKA